MGYWEEDWKFYMITWDEEDAMSPYRCWVRDIVTFKVVVQMPAIATISKRTWLLHRPNKTKFSFITA